MTKIFTHSISQFHRAIIASNPKPDNIAPARRIKNDIPLVSLKQVNNGVILVESGSHVAYLGNRNELRDKNLLSSRLKEFISDPKRYIDKVESSYRQSLVCIHAITSVDSKKYEDSARQEAFRLGISEEQVNKDIATARDQRRKNIFNDKMFELEARFDPNAQRLLHHPFLKSS